MFVSSIYFGCKLKGPNCLAFAFHIQDYVFQKKPAESSLEESLWNGQSRAVCRNRRMWEAERSVSHENFAHGDNVPSSWQGRLCVLQAGTLPDFRCISIDKYTTLILGLMCLDLEERVLCCHSKGTCEFRLPWIWTAFGDRKFKEDTTMMPSSWTHCTQSILHRLSKGGWEAHMIMFVCFLDCDPMAFREHFKKPHTPRTPFFPL